MRSQHKFPVLAVASPQRWGEEESMKPFKQKRSAWNVFQCEQSRVDSKHQLVKVGCRGFVRKYMQPLLSHCEREKTPIRNRRRDGWRLRQRLLFNEALKKPDVKSRWPLTYFRPSTDSFSLVAFDDMKFLVEMTVAVCSPHLPSLHVKYQSKEEGRSAHSGKRASNNVVFNKTDFCSSAEQLEYSLASSPLRRRMTYPHSY